MPSPGVAEIPEGVQGAQTHPSSPAAFLENDGVPAVSSRKGETPIVSPRKPATKVTADLGLPDFGFDSDAESIQKTPTQQNVPARCAPLPVGIPSCFIRVFNLETPVGMADSCAQD